MIPMRALWSLLLFLFHSTIVAASYSDYGRAQLSWPWGRGRAGSTKDEAALKPSTSQAATWTPSLRRLSLAHPTTTSDEAATSTGTDDGTPPSPLSSKTSSGGSMASRTASIASSSSSSNGASRKTTSSTTSNHAKPAVSSTDTTSSSGSSTTTATSSTVPMDRSGKDSQQPPTSSGESTNADNGGLNNTASKKPYDGPLPTVFQWENEDTLNSTKDKQNTHGYFDLANRGPVNPVVDDVLQFLDDDQYKGTKRGRVGKIFPQEKEDPALWPLVAGGIFVVAAIILFAITAYNNCRKRREYQQIPGAVTDAGVV